MKIQRGDKVKYWADELSRFRWSEVREVKATKVLVREGTQEVWVDRDGILEVK